MAEGGNTTGCSNKYCNNYSILGGNHPQQENLPSPPQGNILNATQFCEAFFHVPKVLRWGTDMQCLDEENCRVYDKHDRLPHPNETGTRHQRQPKYVASFVVLKRGENDVKYKAMYENCELGPRKKKHAEEFFDDDARKGTLETILGEIQKPETKGTQTSEDDLAPKLRNLSIANNLKLFMYVTLQPCHYSTKEKCKSCTEILIALYRDTLEPLGIEFVVKPTFIYRAYRSTAPIEKEMAQIAPEDCVKREEYKMKIKQIKNAKKGLKRLCEEGIQVEAMEEKDWILLKKELCPSTENLFPIYERSQRETLDNQIRKFLQDTMQHSDPEESDSDPEESGSMREDEDEEMKNLARKYLETEDNVLKWNGTVDELEKFLSIFSKKEGLGKIEKVDPCKNEDARFKATKCSIFIWYKTKTLLCQGNQQNENKDKLTIMIHG